MRDTSPIRQLTPALRRWRRFRDWTLPVTLTCALMAAFWMLPLRFESRKSHPPKPLKLTLSMLMPVPSLPKRLAPRPRPIVRKPAPRKRVKRRKLRRRRRRLRRRRIVKRRKVVPRPVPRPVIAKPAPPPSPPRPVVQKVARVTRPVPPPRVTPRPVVVRKKPRPVNLGPYRSLLGQTIARHKRYPRIAARMGMQGLVVVLIRISKRGVLVGSPRVVRSSGHGMLDKEAVRMILAAAPFRSMPAAFHQGSATFRLPINFKLADEDT